jgi:hypothetical protein
MLGGKILTFLNMDYGGGRQPSPCGSFRCIPVVVVAKLSIIVVKVFVKLPTAVVKMLFLY